MKEPADEILAAAARQLAGSAPPVDARVAVLGPIPSSAGVPGAERWRFEAVNVEGADPLPDQAFDAAIVTGALERLAWDRWALQQLHRALKVGAPLVLVVPDLAALLSPEGAGFVLGRLLGRIRRRVVPGGAGRVFAGRRYRAAELARTLERLHFRLERGPERTPGGRLLAVARRELALAQRLREGRPPEPAEFVRRFAEEHARFERIRAGWVARNAARVSGTCETIDPAAYAGAKVLVLAPHADDELVGAAGTLLRLVRAGARVTVVHATDGGASAALLGEPDEIRATVRLEEARRVGAALGVERLEFWKRDNRAFRVQPADVARLREILAEWQPGLIVTPFVTDIHPDHFTLNRVLEQALAGAAFDTERCRILYSEIWSHVPANACCDVTEVEEEVERLILLYTTAMKVDDLPHLCESRYYFNSCRLRGRPGFAEAFHAAPASQHAGLMASVVPLDG